MALKQFRKLADIENPHRAQALAWALESANIAFLKHEHFDRRTLKTVFYRFYVKPGWMADARRALERLTPSPDQSVRSYIEPNRSERAAGRMPGPE